MQQIGFSIAELTVRSTCSGHHYAHFNFHVLTTMHGQTHIKFLCINYSYN